MSQRKPDNTLQIVRQEARTVPDCGAPLMMWYITAMTPTGGIKGMRHIALKVKDIARSKSFYQGLLGMEVVWEPDPQNVYLSSGCDNIALHEVAPNFVSIAAEQHLDHFGFVIESIERVKELEQQFRSAGIKIVHPFKIHRDGSASFYCSDPDDIVIQMLYEPQLSRQALE
jgi:catechol 2,3-dioxygenase-like lactoylglutathione lyase family enzyme